MHASEPSNSIILPHLESKILGTSSQSSSLRSRTLSSPSCNSKNPRLSSLLKITPASSSPMPSRKIKWSPQLDLIGPLFDPDGTFHTSPKIMADLLQSQYTPVFSDPDDPKAKMSPLSPQFLEPLTDFTFFPANTQADIEEIDENSSCGENDIPAKVLRQCRSNLSYPIYLLW